MLKKTSLPHVLPVNMMGQIVTVCAQVSESMIISLHSLMFHLDPYAGKRGTVIGVSGGSLFLALDGGGEVWVPRERCKLEVGGSREKETVRPGSVNNGSHKNK